MTVNVLWYVFTTSVCGVCVHIGVGIIVYSCYQGHFRNLKRENRQRYDSTLHFLCTGLFGIGSHKALLRSS